MKKRQRTSILQILVIALFGASLCACSTVVLSDIERLEPSTIPDEYWKAKISPLPAYECERKYIVQRRKAVGLSPNEPVVALCFSGGGLRAATIQLGVLQGLEESNMLKSADYLSSVSGGSYIAAWYVSHLLPKGHTPVRSKKTLFRGGNIAYSSDPATLLQLSPSCDGAVDELMERRGFVLGKGNMHLSWIIPAYVGTLPFNYTFDLLLHWKPVRGKFNLYHPAYLYDRAIRRTYLIQPNELIAGQKDSIDGPFKGLPHEVRIDEINPDGHQAPYLVINATQANAAPGDGQFQHQAMPFEFTRNSVGGPFIGYIHSESFGYPVVAVQNNPDGTGEAVLRANSIAHLPFTTKPYRLASAVAASGAAFDPNFLGKPKMTSAVWPPDTDEQQPVNHSRWHYFYKFSAQVANLHLRQQNRNFSMAPPFKQDAPWNLKDRALDRSREVVYDRFMPSANSNTLTLTDGGHYDNLGIYSMVMRPNVEEIWSFAAYQDKSYGFDSWFQVAELLQMKGWVITPKEGQWLPEYRNKFHPDPNRFTRWLWGPLLWKDSPVFQFILRHRKTGRQVKLYLVKSSLRESDFDKFKHYRHSGRTGLKFPHTSTANVSFNKRDFNAYRELGRILGRQLAAERK